jgi:cell division septation protein DedD
VSRPRERAPSAGIGWLVTLGGAAVLLAFGFGIGLVAGSALEEPELVAKHLAGEATELPLPETTPAVPRAAAPAPPGDGGPARTAAAPPEPGAAREAARPASPAAPPSPRAAVPTPKPVARPAPPPPAVASRPAGFAIQVGAFAERKAAEELVSSLRGDRLKAYVVEGAPTESARFRVRVGPYPTREQAGDEAARIKAKRRLPIWVIAEGGT